MSLNSTEIDRALRFLILVYLPLHSRALDMPEAPFRHGVRCIATSTKALCALFHRYNAVRSLRDVGYLFRRNETWASTLVAWTEDFILGRFQHLLRGPAGLVTPERMAGYKAAIIRAGSPYIDNIQLFGFLDGVSADKLLNAGLLKVSSVPFF